MKRFLLYEVMFLPIGCQLKCSCNLAKNSIRQSFLIRKSLAIAVKEALLSRQLSFVIAIKFFANIAFPFFFAKRLKNKKYYIDILKIRVIYNN